MRQAGETEITPEMVGAGVVAYEAALGSLSDAQIVEAVYTAMIVLRPAGNGKGQGGPVVTPSSEEPGEK
jgi:hypothetical protein